jgi:transcriptional regulator with XRE-family HTH domain
MEKRGIQLRKILAENVRWERKKQNLSQEDLADICNLHRTYIGAIERAERNVTLSTLESLSVGLKVSVAKLLQEKTA